MEWIDAAKAVGVTRSAIYYAIADGRVQVIYVAGKPYISPEALEHYAKNKINYPKQRRGGKNEEEDGKDRGV